MGLVKPRMRPGRVVCACRCLLFPSELRLLGGFLMFFAGILILAFGMSYLLPYMRTIDFREATCTTQYVNSPEVPGDFTPCRCHDDDHICNSGSRDSSFLRLAGSENRGRALKNGEKLQEQSSTRIRPWYNQPNLGEKAGTCAQRCQSYECYSCFPCIHILVRYVATDGKLSFVNGTLHKSRDIIIETDKQPETEDCFHLSCDSNVENNEWTVTQNLRMYAQVGSSYTCFYDRTDPARVMAEKVRYDQVLHSMLWPILIFLAGLGMYISSFVVNARAKRNQKQQDTAKKLAQSHRAMYGDLLRLNRSECPRRGVTFEGGDADEEEAKVHRSSTMPNIPLSESALLAPLFAHAQKHSRFAHAPEHSAHAHAGRGPRTPGKQRRVSVISVSSPKHGGGHTNVAFVVQDQKSLPHSPSNLRYAASPQEEDDRCSLASSKSGNSSYPANFNPTRGLRSSLKREVSSVSAESEGSCGFYLPSSLSLSNIDTSPDVVPDAVPLVPVVAGLPPGGDGEKEGEESSPPGRDSIEDGRPDVPPPDPVSAGTGPPGYPLQPGELDYEHGSAVKL